MLKYFQKIDLIGPEIGIEHNSSNIYKSTFGASISLLIYISCTVIAFMFGQEVYLRKNPNISISQELLPISTFQFNKLNINIQLWDLNGNQIKNTNNYISFKVSYLTVARKNITVDYNKFTAENKNGSIRINTTNDTILQNEFISVPSNSLRIHIFKCTLPKVCADDIEDAIEKLSLTLSHSNTYLNAINYTDPVKTFVKSNSIPLSNYLVKTIEMNVNNNYLESDDGWMLEDKRIFDSFMVSDPIYKYNIKFNGDSEIVLINFASPKLITKTTRNYMKIQQLFALIGGLVTGVTVVSKALFHHYLRFSYLIYFFKLKSADSQSSENNGNNDIFYNDDKEEFKNYENISKFKVMNESQQFQIENLNFSLNKKGNVSIGNSRSCNNLANKLNELNLNNSSKLALFNNIPDNKNNNSEAENTKNSLLFISSVNNVNKSINSSDVVIKDNLYKTQNIQKSKFANENMEISSNVIPKKNLTIKSKDDFESIMENPSYFKYILAVVCFKREKAKCFKKALEQIENALDIKNYKRIFYKL